MFLRRVQVSFALALGLAFTAHAALAQKTETADSGRTRVKVSSQLVSALSSLGVKLGTVEPSTVVGYGVVQFPIVSGALDLDTAKGEIIHSGGLTLSAGKTLVKLQSFTIDTTGSAPVLTGVVVANGALVGRLPLFSLQLPASLKLPLHTNPESVLALYGVNLLLTTQAADALNGAFSVSAFTQGFNIGHADVIAVLAGAEDARN